MHRTSRNRWRVLRAALNSAGRDLVDRVYSKGADKLALFGEQAAMPHEVTTETFCGRHDSPAPFGNRNHRSTLLGLIELTPPGGTRGGLHRSALAANSYRLPDKDMPTALHFLRIGRSR